MTDTGIRAGKGAWQLPRWSMLLLIVSLALNFVIVGLVAGSVWRVKAHQPPIRGVTPNLLGYAASLPQERRDLIWHATAEQRQHIRPFRRDIRTAREEVMQVRSPPSPSTARSSRPHKAGWPMPTTVPAPPCRSSISKLQLS